MSGWISLVTAAAATAGASAASRYYAEGRDVNAPRTSTLVFGAAAASAIAGVALGGLSTPNSIARGLLYASLPIALVGGVYKGFFEAGGLGG